MKIIRACLATPLLAVAALALLATFAPTSHHDFSEEFSVRLFSLSVAAGMLGLAALILGRDSWLARGLIALARKARRAVGHFFPAWQSKAATGAPPAVPELPVRRGGWIVNTGGMALVAGALLIQNGKPDHFLEAVCGIGIGFFFALTEGGGADLYDRCERAARGNLTEVHWGVALFVLGVVCLIWPGPVATGMQRALVLLRRKPGAGA